MKILVVGLGLIGGSICKALKKYGNHFIVGSDINKEIESTAISDGSIDEIFSGDFCGFDVVIISLYPEATQKFFCENADKMDEGTIITDVCGIKGVFSENMYKIACENNLEYIGIHPMAGKEFGGYGHSTSDLFFNANFIITPLDNNKPEVEAVIRKLILELGAGNIIITSPQKHDKMIAYTSQLAHIVSSAYVKSPELALECGFSGGSFQDMTRIATMNEKMWTDLFMQNRLNLKFELDILIDNLQKYSDALDKSDIHFMEELIKEGRILKEDNLKKRKGQPN